MDIFRHRREDRNQGGDWRTLEDQNVYDDMMMALSGDDMETAKLGSALRRTLFVSHPQVMRSRAIRNIMKDMDYKRWIRRPSIVPINAIGTRK